MEQASQITSSPVGTEALGTVLLGLFAVLALIMLLAWLAKRFKLLQNHKQGFQIKTLANLPVSTREKITLIEVGGEQFLNGCAPGQVSKLHHFKEPVKADTNVEPTGFADQLKQVINAQKSSGANT